MVNTLTLPLRDGFDLSSKRVYLQFNHWLSISCPDCSKKTVSGRETPLFSYGSKKAHFWCEYCDYEQANAIEMHGIDADDNILVRQASDFLGAISHCRFVEEVVSTITPTTKR